MKKLLHLLSFFVLFALPFGASAATFEGTDVFILEEGEIINDDLFIGAERVQIDGDVNGDLFVGATIIDISGNVSGSVFAGGSEVAISGDIENDLFLGSGTTRLSGSVGDNVYAGTGILTAANGFETGKDLILGAGDASVDGIIGKNLVVGAGALTLLGNVDGSAYLSVSDDNGSSQAGRITLGREAEIAGNLEYESPVEADINPNAIIGGAIDYTPGSGNSTAASPEINLGFDFNNPVFMFLNWLWNFVIALVVAFIFAAVYTKKKIIKIDLLAREEVGKTFGYGLLVLIVGPVIIFLIGITIIGIPIAIILGLLYAIFIYAASAFIAIAAGRMILQEKPEEDTKNIYLAAFLGVLVTSILTAIPVIGGLVAFVLLVLGLGALTLDWKVRRDAKKNNTQVAATSPKKEVSSSSKKTKITKKKESSKK